MPLDPRLVELLAPLEQYAGDSKEKAREVALALLDKAETKPIAEVLLKRGLGKRTAAAEEAAVSLQSEITALKDQLAEAKAEAEELRSNQPNWQRRIEEAERKWASKVETAEQRAAAERQARLDERVAIERQRFLAKMRLGQEGGVEEDWGRDVLPARFADRFRPDPESGKVRVLEIGESDTYYDPADGDPVDQLARDAMAQVPAKYRILGDPDGGGGTQGNGKADKALAQVRDTKARTGLYQL